MEIPPLKTFICYAREDRKAVEELRKHLTLLEKKRMLEVWYDGEILAGQNWDKSIKKSLEQAELVLMFISVDFINSEYIEKTELQAALQRHRDGLARLIPVIVHPCDWSEYFEMGQFQALPNQARPIFSSHFSYAQEAFYEIQQGIKRTAQDLLEKRAAQLRAEAEAAELSLREEEARLTREQETVNRAAVEKNRAERLLQLDETAWRTALSEVETADNERDKIIPLETYLDEQAHTLHRAEAESRLAELKAADTKRRIEERKRLEAQRQAEEEKRQKTDVEKERKRREEAERQKRKEEARAKSLSEMIPIKGGTFEMGDTFGDGFDWEKPVHKVTVSDFYLGECAVTFEEFDRFCDETKREKPKDAGWGRGRHPVINVNWGDAQAYCKWLSSKTNLKFRLPTEAEWEFAAREGGKKVRFGNGKDIADPTEINFDSSKDYKQLYSVVGEYRQKTISVDTFRPNALGLYQMSGNVWEWCEDWYGRHPLSTQTNPVGPATGSLRVVRGGSWSNDPQDVRAASRGGVAPGGRNDGIGFRLARTV